VGLAAAVVMLGLSLASYDEQRRHIPGHVLYYTLVTMPALIQVAYLVPLYRAARRRRCHTFAWGLCVGAGLVVFANGVFVWVGHAISRID
jgi:hypothetical protein